MDAPIVMTAFGTTTKAHKTYQFIDKMIRERFPASEIRWAYTSRQVKAKVNQNSALHLKNPREVLDDLKAEGHDRAVVQSLHVICGHEYYRLMDDIRQCDIDSVMGKPLLTSAEDYQAVVKALDLRDLISSDQAVILVGHGTNHPCWTAYPTLEGMFRAKYGSNLHVGVVSWFPPKEKTIKAVIESGVKRVRLIPLMLVAGVHFQEDLAGENDSWKSDLEQNGLSVVAEEEGLGFNKDIIEIYIKHLEEAWGK